MAVNAHALTTYATVKAELGLANDTLQSVVERMINAVSESIEQVCDRHFEYTAGIQENIAGPGGYRIFVKRTPLKTIHAINLLNPDGTIALVFDPLSYVIENAGAGIIYRTAGTYSTIGAYASGASDALQSAGWPWLAQPGDDIRSSPMPGTERPGLQVVYSGGWVTPAQATDGMPRDLPADLEEAAIIAVSAMWSRRGRSRDVSSEATIAGSSISYRLPDGDGGILPPESLATAMRYRRVS